MDPILLGKGITDDVAVTLLPKLGNRHGLVAGATGWCTAAPNLIPALNLALWDAVQQGQLAEARTLFYRQYELLEYITRRGLPTTIKAGLKLLGQDVGAPRLPLQPLDAQGNAYLKNLLVALAS